MLWGSMQPPPQMSLDLTAARRAGERWDYLLLGYVCSGCPCSSWIREWGFGTGHMI